MNLLQYTAINKGRFLIAGVLTDLTEHETGKQSVSNLNNTVVRMCVNKYCATFF